MHSIRCAVSGVLAGAICVLPLFQGLWTACALAGLRFEPYPPGGVPLILSLAAAGGVLGGVFTLSYRGSPDRAWRDGAKLGLLISLMAWFVAAPLAGAPIASDWQPVAMAQTLSVFLIWGLSLGFVAPILERAIGR